jgi:type II secretory pathway component PulF
MNDFTPQPQKSVAIVFITLLHFTVISLVFLILGIAVPQYAAVISDLNVNISPMTVWTVRLGNLVSSNLFLLISVTFLIDIGVIFLTNSLPVIKMAWIYSILFLGMLLMAFVCVSLCMIAQA